MCEAPGTRHGDRSAVSTGSSPQHALGRSSEVLVLSHSASESGGFYFLSLLGAFLLEKGSDMNLTGINNILKTLARSKTNLVGTAYELATQTK